MTSNVQKKSSNQKPSSKGRRNRVVVVSQQQTQEPSQEQHEPLSVPSSSSLLSILEPKPESDTVVDLLSVNIPYQEPILKHEYNTKGFRDNYRTHPIDPNRSSKYVGVYYDTISNKWRAQMMIQKKVHNLGCFINEEEAGSMYAKAAYLYKRRGPETGIYGGLDLRNIPDQPLIVSDAKKSSTTTTTTTKNKATSSKYKGVKICKGRWQARISQGSHKSIHLGTFDTMEEAAQVYANAIYYLEQNNTTTDNNNNNNNNNTTESNHKTVEIVKQEQQCCSTTGSIPQHPV